MAFKLADRVKENTTSTGTGGVSLTGSPTGFQTFSSVMSSGDTTYYAIEENDKWEVGYGTYGSNNLTRTSVLASSNSNNQIDLGGSGVVFMTYPAGKAIINDVNDQFVVSASGLVFANGSVLKDLKITELYDVNSSGTPASSHLMSFDITNKSLLIGDITGPSNNSNILIGYGAGSGVTTGTRNTIIGTESATVNQTGYRNVHIGDNSGPIDPNSSIAVYQSVSVGSEAGDKMRHNSIAVGYQSAAQAYEIGFVSMGSLAGSGIGSYSTAVGHYAAHDLTDDYTVSIGYKAGYSAGGEDSVWVGREAGHSSSSATRSMGFGKNAGKSSSGNDCIYVGLNAGESNSNNNQLFIGYAAPSSQGTLIKGDMSAKRVAIGVADVTLSDTLHVNINAASDRGIVVKGASAQSADLTQWTNSADEVVAAVCTSGVINTYGVVASGAGINLARATPSVTTETLYNVAGDLYFDGSKLVEGGDIYADEYIYHNGDTNTYIRFRGDQIDFVAGNVTMLTLDEASNDKVIINNGKNNVDFQVESDVDAYLIYTDAANDMVGIGTNGPAYKLDVFGHDAWMRASGVIVGNSGVVLANNAPAVTTNTLYNDGGTLKFDGSAVGGGDVTTAQLTYVSGIAVYGSGQVLSLNSASGVAAYASGNTANITFGSNAEGDILYHNGTSFTRLAKGTDNYVLTMDGNVPVWEASSGGGDVTTAQLTYVSGIAVYGSGQALSLNSASGIASYASGQALSLTYASGLTATNATNITSTTAVANYASGEALSLNSASGIANYASGQAIANESDIVAVSGIAAYGSGHAHDTTYVSGIATYASGEALSLNSASGIASYASGQALSLTYASGLTATNATNITSTTAVANYASGEAVSLTHASGLTATNATNITSTTAVANYASGEAVSLNSASGVAAYASGNTANIAFGSNAEGDLLYHNGTSFTRLAKGTDNHVLTMDGNVPGWEASSSGGGVSAADLTYVSGIAVYGSGQVLSLNTASGIANYASGEALSLNSASGIANYASGEAVSLTHASGLTATNATVANYASGEAVSLTYASGLTATNAAVANYASGEAVSLTYASGLTATNATNITSTTAVANYASGEALSLNSASGIATYASGEALSLNSASGIAGYASGQAIENEGLATYASGEVISLNSASGIATYASGEVLSLNAASGMANYASGNTANIAFGSNAEGDILYHNGTSFTRLAKGTDNHVLTMDGNVPNWEAAAGGSVAGSDGQIQYNNGGSAFGGASNLYYNDTSNRIGIGTSSPAYGLDVVGAGASGIIQASGIQIGPSGIMMQDNGISGLSGIVFTDDNIQIGTAAFSFQSGVSIGKFAGSGASGTDAHVISIGYGANAKTTDTTSLYRNIAIGGLANYNSKANYSVLMGYGVHAYGELLSRSVAIGYNAAYANTATSTHAVFIGYQAGYLSAVSTESIGIGYQAGRAQNGTDNISMGYNAGYGVVGSGNIEILNHPGPAGSIIGTNDEKIHIGTTIIGDMGVKKLAIGLVTASDLTPDATLEILPKAASDVGFIVQGAAAHSADLTQWQTSAGVVVAAMTPSGVLNVTDIRTSGTQVILGKGATATNGTAAIGQDSTVTGAGGVAIGYDAYAKETGAIAMGRESDCRGQYGLAIGDNATVSDSSNNSILIGRNTSILGSYGQYAVGVGSYSAAAEKATALGAYTDAIGERSVAIGYQAQAHGTSWVIASGITPAEVGISGVFGSYVSIPNDQKLAVGGSEPTYTVDALGHDAWVRGSGLIAGASGIVMQDADLSHAITLKAPDVVSTSFTLPLPSGIGTNGQVLTTDSVQTYWSTVSASAAGSDGQIQYNNGGSALGGTSNLYYNDTTNRIGVGTSSPAYGVDVTGAGASGIIQASGLVVGVSGIVLANNAPGVTTNTLYNVGGSLYFHGSSVSDIGTYASGEALSLNSASGIATYASGEVVSLNAASGMANYASGNTANIAFGSNAEGDMLYHNGTSFTRLAKGTDNHVLTMDGNVPGWEAASGGGASAAQLTYVSGIAVYGSGQVLSLNSASGIASYASGEALSLNSASGQVAYSSGVLTGGNPTFGDMYVGEYVYHNGDTDTYVRFQDDSINIYVGNRAMIKMEEATNDKVTINNGGQDVDFRVKGENDDDLIRTDAANDRVGIGTDEPSYKLDVLGHDAWVRAASGVIVGASGVVLADNAPGITTNTLYNVGGSLYFHGSSVSDIGTYASGEALSLNSASGIATYASGEALSLNAASGIANYASGQVNVGAAGTATASKALVLDSSKKFTGVKDGSFSQSDSWVNTSGLYVGASGIGVGTSTPEYDIDVVGHSGVIRASGLRGNIHTNADAATVHFDLGASTTHHVILGGNRTLAIDNVAVGDKFVIRLQQDDTGSRTITWFSHIKWAGGSAPTLTSTRRKTDLVGFIAASGTGGAYWYDGLVIGQNI